MFVKNDPEKKFVNGTIGTLIDLTHDSIKVKITDVNDDFYYVPDVQPRSHSDQLSSVIGHTDRTNSRPVSNNDGCYRVPVAAYPYKNQQQQQQQKQQQEQQQQHKYNNKNDDDVDDDVDDDNDDDDVEQQTNRNMQSNNIGSSSDHEFLLNFFPETLFQDAQGVLYKHS